jgi:hypothetical protein
MSSTEPAGGYTPARLHFPGTGKSVGHRLRTRTILIIIAVIILIAAAATAGIVLPGSTSQPKPPPSAPGKLAAMSTESLSVSTTAQTGVPVVVSRTSSAISAQVRLTTAAAVPLPNGLSLTPADGWTVNNTQSNGVWLCNSDCTASLWVGVGHSTITDVGALLQAQINNQTSGSKSGFTNVQTAQLQTEELQSNNFQRHAWVGYTANVSTQQGTIPTEGIFSSLLNTSTGVTAFLNLEASSDAAFNQAAPANKTMAASML